MNWGVANPEPRRVLVQLQASGMLSQETIEAGSAPFVEMQNTIRDAIEQHIVRTDLPGGVAFEDAGGIGGSDPGADWVKTSYDKQVSQWWI